VEPRPRGTRKETKNSQPAKRQRDPKYLANVKEIRIPCGCPTKKKIRDVGIVKSGSDERSNKKCERKKKGTQKVGGPCSKKGLERFSASKKKRAT